MENQNSNLPSNPFRGDIDLSHSQNPAQPQSQSKNTQVTPIHLIILLSIFAAIVLIIITLVQVFRENPYGSQIKINNIDKYYKGFSTNTKDSIFNTLYNIASTNNPETQLPKSGAKIRDGSTSGYRDKTTNIYTENFIVDIEELQQSYVFQVIWSPDRNNPKLTNIGYPVLATCPQDNQLIYPAFDCVDSFSSNGIYNDPVFSILPINIDYYKDNYSIYVAYSIIAQVKDDKLTIIINDKTGGNRSAAINKLKEQGINPDNYTIVYNDLSAEQVPSRAPNDANL